MNYEVARAHRCELGQARVGTAHLTENDVVAAVAYVKLRLNTFALVKNEIV